MSERIEAIVEEWIESHGMDDMGLDVPDLIARFKAARIAVVDLPEPDMSSGSGQVWTTRERYNGPVGDVQYRPQTGRIEIRDDYEYDYDPKDIRVDAAVLLAAFAASEASK